MNCPMCTFMAGANATACDICGFQFVAKIVHWKTKTGTIDIPVSKFYQEEWKIHEPYEQLVGNTYFNPDHPIMNLHRELNDEAVRAYCEYLAHPECCVRVLIARFCNEDIIKAIEANHSIITLHIYENIADENIQRVIKHKDLYTLTIGGRIRQLKSSPEGGIPPLLPYSELTIRDGFSSYRDIDLEPFLATASQLSSLKFFVGETNAAMVQTMFDTFVKSTLLSKLNIGITADETTAPVFWDAATEFVQKSTSIRKLNVRCDGAGHDNSMAFIKEMTRNTRITHLSFWCDFIDEKLCNEIITLIRTNTHLRRLKLNASQMFSGSSTDLADALKANKTLKKLTLCGFGDSYDYLNALLVNNTITSFRTDSWDQLVKHCTVVAQILKKNVIRSISMPMRWAVDQNDLYEAIKTNTSLRSLKMNILVNPIFAEKKFMCFQFAPFNMAQLHQAIEMVNLSPPWLAAMDLGFEEPTGLSPFSDLLVQKVKARTTLQRYWAVHTLQTLQLFTARDLGLLAAIPLELRVLIARLTPPAYVLNDKQFDFIVKFSTRKQLQHLVTLHKTLDLNGYDELVEEFLYNLLLLQ